MGLVLQDDFGQSFASVTFILATSRVPLCNCMRGYSPEGIYPHPISKEGLFALLDSAMESEVSSFRSQGKHSLPRLRVCVSAILDGSK